MTDDSICWNSWADLHEPAYKSPKRLIDSLVDIVAKNGSLLLNIPPTANGRIPKPVQERLLEMGAWLDINAGRQHVANNPFKFGRNVGGTMMGQDNADFFL